MSWSVLLRASLAQAIAVGALFALLLALPLPSEFFREQGAWIGPVSWLACALVAGSVLGLRAGRVLAAAAVSGLAAIAASFVLGHSAGMVAGVITFGLACAVRVGGPLSRVGARTRRLRLPALGSSSRGGRTRPHAGSRRHPPGGRP